MKPILYASDFSPASRPAFGRALAEARRDRAPLVIAHVMTPPVQMMVDGYMTPTAWDAFERGYRKVAQKKLDALVGRARASGVRVRGLLLEGTPAAQILRAAKAARAGLIVVGTHGRTGFARVVLGSVAGRVVAGARCPVLTVGGRA